MQHIIEKEIQEELKKEERQLGKIKTEVDLITKKLIEEDIEHFSSRDMNNAFFGSLLIGLTFVFKGLLIEVGMKLPWKNVIMIIVSTLLLLTSEIYYVGYAHVKDKASRPFPQFLLKRLSSMYMIAIVVSFFLLYLFGFKIHAESADSFMKLVFIVAMPCAIGAAIPNMLRPN